MARGAVEIADDRQAGASELARRAIDLLSERADDLRDLDHLLEEASRIAELRPSMAAIEGALRIYTGCVRQRVEAGEDLAGAARSARREARSVLDGMRQQVVDHACDVLEGTPHSRVVTVSCSSTVTALLDRRPPPSLLVGEGRPGLEGRTTAARYARRGVQVELCVDAALPGRMRTGDLIVVGADAVQADGQLVNKIGSLAMAVRAREMGVPFLVACETFKFSRKEEIPLEQKEPGEVWADAPGSLVVTNFYFERVPPSLVTGFMTDRGTIRHGDPSWPG